MSAILPYRVYRDTGGTPREAPACEDSVDVAFWHPSLVRPCPPLGNTPRFLFWGAFHTLRLFRSRKYGAIILSEYGILMHRSVIFPAYFTFPFMAPADIQVGATETLVAARGRGLAARAIVEVVARYASPSRRVWYVCSELNVPSWRAAERAGLGLVGRASHVSRFGIRSLGHFVYSPFPDHPMLRAGTQ